MTEKPVVAVLSLGGTIAMTSTDNDGPGVRPRLDAAAFLDAVPAVTAIADIRAHSLRSLPGASLRFDDVLECLDVAKREVEAGAAGVVVTQGTDTLEESAYLLDLLWDRAQPLVVTGAMRHPELASADGPGNVLASVTVAASATARQRGVLTVFNDEIHAARYVRKTHSSALCAFTSPDTGAVGRVREGAAFFLHSPPRFPALPAPPPGQWPNVALVEAVLDESGGLLRLIDDAYDALVVGAFGVGHVSEGMADQIEKLASRIPVVFASRAGAGGTYERTYGFPGSEQDLVARGAIPAGLLDPRKARILLTVLLANGADQSAIRAAFSRYGHPDGIVGS